MMTRDIQETWGREFQKIYEGVEDKTQVSEELMIERREGTERRCLVETVGG